MKLLGGLQPNRARYAHGVRFPLVAGLSSSFIQSLLVYLLLVLPFPLPFNISAVHKVATRDCTSIVKTQIHHLYQLLALL